MLTMPCVLCHRACLMNYRGDERGSFKRRSQYRNHRLKATRVDGLKS
ncbi:hypothetical protein AB205_0220690 [Aquarana catesbeiana]|uniref:Uncharacterized protein n=1 Tax=Aquarana catesbeiana TaxID=8400 RepID=A0A2G9RW19_AQUCT|nr:hypothetical protein AB205_0220690 [Aquarana catesbeiana]